MGGGGGGGGVLRDENLRVLGQVFWVKLKGPPMSCHDTWRFMGTSNPSYTSTYNLLRGLRGLLSRLRIRVISSQNLQVSQFFMVHIREVRSRHGLCHP